ncbi:hypothetical protein SNE40_005248 [Patella caerulea]|uniref:Fidgetin-like protein 1 n=1 Tax=Patella caerulea TaxID=87958 RepID=A0AAN8K2J6_PATCE
METGKENEAGFLSRLQSLTFDSKLENGTPSQKADLIRNIIVHLNSAQYEKIVCEETCRSFVKDYQKMYEEIVDCFDDNTGLNNFAAGALNLCSGKKNESQSWNTSLSLEKIKQMSFFTDYMLNCQSKADLFVATKENSAPLFRPRKKKLVVESQNSKPENEKQLLVCYTKHAETQPTGQNPSTFTKPPSFVQFAPVQDNQCAQKLFGSGPQNNGHNIVTNNNNNSEKKQHYFTPIQNNRDYRQEPPRVPVYQNKANLSDMGESSKPSESSYSRTQYTQKKSLFSNGKGSSTNYGNNNNYGNKRTFQKKNDWRKRQREQDDEDDDDEEMEEKPALGPFKTAKEQMAINQQKKYGGQNRGQGYIQGQVSTALYGGAKKSLGTRRGPSSKFIPPVINREEDGCIMRPDNKPPDKTDDEPIDERLKGIDPKMIELINNEIMDHGPKLHWDDVAGLEFAKKTIKEIVVWPMLRPDIFTGLRGPPKGLLLFGPPGTGKTLIGKCIASQSKSTFFCISASSLTSKWVGEGEKMVRALFAVARCNQPAVVFIDEIDSLLSQRSDNEHEASRRIKTEFLVQLDGAATDSDDKILIIGATNRPQEIDEAARRRLVKRLYIPLPEDIARRQIITNLLSQQKHELTDQHLDIICQKSDGYSGSDMANLCREAALGPIRSIPFEQIETITSDEVRAIKIEDFLESLNQVRASVSAKDLDLYTEWNKLYGSFGK